jgi:hypothetical protein
MPMNQALNELIQLSANELVLLQADDVDLTLLQQQEKLRFKQLNLLFSTYSKQALSEEVDSLNQIITLDKQLLSLIHKNKDNITQKVLAMRAQNKVSKAYKNL